MERRDHMTQEPTQLVIELRARTHGVALAREGGAKGAALNTKKKRGQSLITSSMVFNAYTVEMPLHG